MLQYYNEGVIKNHALVKMDDEISVNQATDSLESGKKLRYQLAEVFVYIGWPVLIMWVITSIATELNKAIVASLGFAIFAWPYIKVAAIGKIIAQLKKTRNPRKVIRSSSFWYDGFMFVGSPMLREIRQYSAFSRSLDVIYNVFGRFGVQPQKFVGEWSRVTSYSWLNTLVKRWSLFWVDMPVAQDVRTRLEIVTEQYHKTIRGLALSQPDKTIHILEVAGGQIQAVIMGIARAKSEGIKFDYQVVSIEPDKVFSKPRALELIQYFGLDEKSFTFIRSGVSITDTEKCVSGICLSNGFDHSKFDMVVCIGLGDYFYTHQSIVKLLKSFDGCGSQKIVTCNISDNWVERWFLHTLIQWPKMKYRSLYAWESALSEAYENRNISIIQTPHKIFNIAVIE